MYTVNMMSKADITKGHGVLSAQCEQVALVRETMSDVCQVKENAWEKHEITHYHSINPELFLSIPFMKRKGKCVGYVHFLPETVENSIQLPKIIKKMFYKYMLWFYKSMDYLVTVNPYFIKRLEAYGIKKDKVYYIPNYVSADEFYPLEAKQKKEIRSEYGVPEDKFTVLCVGQLQTRKGIFEFVEIAKRMPDIQFVWAGDFSFGKISDGYEQIKEMMQDLPDNTKFLGLVDREKMNQVYNMADVMFLPSFEELFPMTILESMNCKIPILVRDLEIYEPILFDYAIRGRSNEEFIHLLTKLKRKDDYYEAYAEKAYQGHEHYSKERVAAMWRNYYGHIICQTNKETLDESEEFNSKPHEY